ncbi:MAG: hypothetical protein A2Y25_01170 [Candidatus Melainabacteria bacterium GWF2_37_15]|nr:MAG: hypothetical protein A2Y25_01170 [Candidatus Melainabacteria bacterium GWF2_37_15]
MTHNYTFTIKKGKVELEVISDDKYFIVTEFDKIFKELSKHTKRPEITIKTPKLEPQPEPEKPAQINETETPKFEPEKELEEVKAEPKNNFQEIIKQKIQEELSVNTTKPKEKAEEKDLETPEEPLPKKSKVYDILEEKLASLPEEEKNRLNLYRKEENSKSLKFSSLEDLIDLKKPQTKLDYLLIISYYLQERESQEKYSLKNINSLAVPHVKSAIDHSIVHEAVASEYFEVIPDYLGTTGITEYKITNEGIDYIINEL